jgi:hypothetical protein
MTQRNGVPLAGDGFPPPARRRQPSKRALRPLSLPPPDRVYIPSPPLKRDSLPISFPSASERQLERGITLSVCAGVRRIQAGGVK